MLKSKLNQDLWYSIVQYCTVLYRLKNRETELMYRLQGKGVVIQGVETNW